MRIDTFYRKYANVPVPNRFHPHTQIKDGFTDSMNLYDMYKLIEEQNTKRMDAEVELKRLLNIAEKMLH